MTIRSLSAILFLYLGISCDSSASADSREVALPRRRSTFSGAVRYADDGDGPCIGPQGRPDLWIEIRLVDFYAPELHGPVGIKAKRRLERLAMRQRLVRRASRCSYDRVIAACTLRGRPVGKLLRAAGRKEGGRGWRK